VQLRKIRHNSKGRTIHSFSETSLDYLFVVVENGTAYLIPVSEVTAKKRFNLDK
jgi:hypothetical protein